MVNYQNGKIYRLVCNVTGKQYIGSTCIPLATRLYQHKRLFKNGKSGTSKFVLENNNCNIVLLEDFPCDRKELLLQRERYYIDNMDCINKNIPTRNRHEWYENNKEKYIERQKLWNNNNKDKLKEYQKTFKNKNKGISVDLTELDVDDEENIKLNIEDIYLNNEMLDEVQSIITDLINKNIITEQ